MQQNVKEQIAHFVRDNINVETALGVMAAIECAEQHWDDHCTELYGTIARDIVMGKITGHTPALEQ